METFSRYWPFVWGIHQSPVNSPRKGQWRKALMVFFICAWINGCVNNREAGDLRRRRAHYVIVMNTLYVMWKLILCFSCCFLFVCYFVFVRFVLFCLGLLCFCCVFVVGFFVGFFRHTWGNWLRSNSRMGYWGIHVTRLPRRISRISRYLGHSMHCAYQGMAREWNHHHISYLRCRRNRRGVQGLSAGLCWGDHIVCSVSSILQIHVDGLVQDCSNSIANALELL